MIQWVEASVVAQYPTKHRTAPTGKNFLAPNVKSADVRHHDLDIINIMECEHREGL